MSSKPSGPVLLRLGSLLLLFASGSTALAQQTVPLSEERLVRQTYLRLSLLHRADLQRNAARQRDVPRQQDAAIAFVLTDFHTGPIEEILSRPIAEVATFPTGEIVRLVERTSTERSTPGETVSYQAQWTAADYTNAYDPKTTPLSEMLKVMGASYLDVGKYTSYSVTVTLQGRSRSYRALVLYHSPYGSSIDPKPEFWDAIVGSGGVLTDILRDSRPATGAPRLRQRDESQPPDLDRNPLDSINHETAIANVLGSYCDGVWPICCPPESGGLDECCWDTGYPWGNPGYLPDCRARADGGGGGGGGGDSGGGGDFPTSSPEPACQYQFRSGSGVNLYHSDTAGHYDGYKLICEWPSGVPLCYSIPLQAGEHRAETLLHGECVTETDCRKRCNVVVDNHTVFDYGNTFLFHVVKEKNADNNDATGDASATLTCSAGYGYAVDQCLSPFCAVNLVVSISASPLGVGVGGGVSVQSSAMWSIAHGLGHQCEPSQ